MRVPRGTLTPSQKEVLAYIRRCIEQGMPPTRDEIARHFGWRSPNSAQCHIEALRRKGALTTVPGTSRGLRLTQAFATDDRDALGHSYRDVVVTG